MLSEVSVAPCAAASTAKPRSVRSTHPETSRERREGGGVGVGARRKGRA
jgi:hypothetical protein